MDIEGDERQAAARRGQGAEAGFVVEGQTAAHLSIGQCR
jgi:hypothetical protein